MIVLRESPSSSEIATFALREVAVCLVSCLMLASAEVNAQDIADQFRAIERAWLRALVDADMPTASRFHADDFELANVAATLEMKANRTQGSSLWKSKLSANSSAE